MYSEIGRPERKDFPNLKHNVCSPLLTMTHPKSTLLYSGVKAIYVQKILLQRLDSDVFSD